MAARARAGKALTIAAICQFRRRHDRGDPVMIFAPALSTVVALYHSAEYFALIGWWACRPSPPSRDRAGGQGVIDDPAGLDDGAGGRGRAVEHCRAYTSATWSCIRAFPSSRSPWRCFAPARSRCFLVMNPARARRVTRQDHRAADQPVRGEIHRPGDRPAIAAGGSSLSACCRGRGARSRRSWATRSNATSPRAPKQEESARARSRGWPAPENRNNAACTGSFRAAADAGHPGSGTTRSCWGALIALNVTPGPRLMIDEPAVFWAVIISMYIGQSGAVDPELAVDPLHREKILAIPAHY